MNATPSHDGGIFDGGPPAHAEAWMGLTRRGEPQTISRMVFCVAVGWLPLTVIAALQQAIVDDKSFASFISDVAIHVRSLLVAPLLVLAEAIILPRLGAIADQFTRSGIVPASEQPHLAQARESTVTWRDSQAVEAVVIALAYATTLGAMQFVPAFAYSPWHTTRWASGPGLSFAGWWHICVSLPLLLVLLYSWIWRVFLWARFLALISRLDLRLIPSHPDHAGGLGFVGNSVQSFSILGFVFGALVAGMAANRVLRFDAQPLDFKYTAAGAVVFAILLFCAPLTVFTRQLVISWRRGTMTYGALARDVGQHFEAKWFARRSDATSLDAPDFSATTDLYSIAANVYAMRTIPVTLSAVTTLAAVTLLPFLPVVLMTVSLEQLLERLGSLLF